LTSRVHCSPNLGPDGRLLDERLVAVFRLSCETHQQGRPSLAGAGQQAQVRSLRLSSADKVLRTDKLLEAWADKRMGSASIENVDVFWWGDAKNVMDNGANGLDQRLVLLGTQQTALTATAN
jgi:hypothetical protein